MIKLFEEYVDHNHKFDVLSKKMETFLEEVKDPGDSICLSKSFISIVIGDVKRRNAFRVTENISIFTEYDYEEYIDQMIQPYLFFKLSPLSYRSKTTKFDNVSLIPMEYVNIEELKKVEFSKEEFEEFKDASRFGLFEQYRGKIIVDKFLDKIYNFIKLIKDENDKVNIDTHQTTRVVRITKGYEYLLSINDTVSIFVPFSSEMKGKYKPLADYFFEKISEYINSSEKRSGDYFINYTNFTEEIIDNINFSKEEYEIFKETERFGL